MDQAIISGTFFLIALLSGGVCAVAGFLLLDRVDRGGAGIALGFLLGPIGLVIAWVIRDNALRDEEAHARRQQRRNEGIRDGDGRRGGRFGGQAVPGSAGAGPSADVAALERLASLRERGHITQEEFERKKREIFGVGAPNGAYAQPPVRTTRRFR